MGKGRLANFSPNCSAIILLSKKNIFPFSQVEQFGYDNVPNEGTVKFLQKFGTISTYTRPFTHTRPFNGPLSGTTRVSRYQKGKTNLDFTGARDSEWARASLHLAPDR